MANHRHCIIAHPFLLVNLIAFLSLACIHVLATQHIVGDSSGWDVGVDYTAWASRNTFKTGDTLLFTYSGVHSVVQVDEADYKPCSTANYISSSSSGRTVVNLDKAQTYYFMCGVTAHCQQGMKLSVAVGGGAPATPMISPPTTPSTSNAHTSAASPRASLSFAVILSTLLVGGAATVISYASLSM